jgi:hypothetical protein
MAEDFIRVTLTLVLVGFTWVTRKASWATTGIRRGYVRFDPVKGLTIKPFFRTSPEKRVEMRARFLAFAEERAAEVVARRAVSEERQ